MSTIAIIPPGTETDEAYHASGAWGSTLISRFLRSPRLAHLMRTGQYRMPDTAAMRFGRWFHHRMDPGSAFAAHYRQGPEADRRTKAWKEAEAVATAEGLTLIEPDDWAALDAMRASVLRNPVAASLITGAEHETGFRMPSPYGPFQVQCRADALVRWNHVVDLKTTSDVDDFPRSVVQFGYHRQAALYRWLIGHACGEPLPFSLIAVEKDAPLYRCRVFDLEPALLDLGWQEVEAVLIELGERTIRDDWDDHRDADLVAMPSWLKPRAVEPILDPVS